MFSVTLEKKRVFLKTNKEMWLSRDCEMAMINMQQKIKQRATQLQIDLDALSTDVLMSSRLPWEKAWVSFENQVLQLEMEQLKLSLAALLGHKSKTDVFKDPSPKYKAKLRVISEL